MSTSTASLYLNKNYGQYISVLESELARGGQTAAQQCVLHSNIATAQLELGLNRKAIKSAQTAIDLTGCAGGIVHRAYIVKGKALLASGKPGDAIQAWKDGMTACCREEPFADVTALEQLHSLISAHEQSSTPIQPSVPVVDTAEQTQPSAPTAASATTLTPPLPPTTTAAAVRTSNNGSPVTAETATPAPPTKPASAAPERNTTTRKDEPNAPVSPKKGGAATTSGTPDATAGAPVNDGKKTAVTRAPPGSTPAPSKSAAAPPATTAGTASTAKETYRVALAAIHRRSIGDGENMIKPFYLNAIRANLPHVCGEALIDDLVCLAYMNVNGGSFDTATNIFQLINNYRGDVPSAMIGAGSIAAMQRNFDVAIKEFSDAIAIDGTIADAWKRRGQTRAARGLVKSAIKDLTKAISLLPGEADMYHQRGLVYHQTRNYTRALADFRVAHEKGMESAPLWNYIGMCEGQLGRVAPSLTAHERALRLQATFKEAQLNVALMHKEAGNWSQALVAFNKAIKCDTTAPFFQAHGHRGLMYIQLGRPALALKDLTTAVNALFTIVVGSAGATLNAEEKATRKTELIQHLLRAGLCYQTVGQYHKAVGYFDQAATLLPSTNGLFLREIALFLWSSLDVDLVLYNADDRVDPRLKDGWCKHADWVDYMAPHLAAAKTGAAAQNAGLASSSAITSGALLGTGPYTPTAKPTQVPCLSRYSSGVAPDDDGELLPAPAEATGKPSSTPSEGMRNEEQKLHLVSLTTPFAKLIQMDSPGFMPNRRQHRMFGLAVLQMATSLSQHFALIGQEGIGLQVPDAASSRKFSTARTAGQAGTVSGGKKKQGSSSSGSKSAASSSGSGADGSTDISDGADSTEGSSARSHSPSGKRGVAAATHTFNWRDLYDIAVRWRQVSEPGDPVWWIDRFPTKAFEDGFGLQTPLVNGHLTTVRYAPYYQPAFDRVKDILLHQGYYTVSDVHMTLDTEAAARVAVAATLHELRAAVGSNFYVVVPCPSLRAAALVLEGTRLTLLTQEPEGFDFTIRTPGKPYRWSQYEEELSAGFHRLEETFLHLHQQRSRSGGMTNAAAAVEPGAPPPAAVADDERILRTALELYYLWVTFAPLSRGTAACGYAGLCAVLLSLGKKIAAEHLLPAGKQLDWEAILAVDFPDFWEKVRGWFKLVDAGELLCIVQHPWVSRPSAGIAVAGAGAGDAVFDCVRTLRDMLDVMCLPYEK